MPRCSYEHQRTTVRSLLLLWFLGMEVSSESFTGSILHAMLSHLVAHESRRETEPRSVMKLFLKGIQIGTSERDWILSHEDATGAASVIDHCSHTFLLASPCHGLASLCKHSQLLFFLSILPSPCNFLSHPLLPIKT